MGLQGRGCETSLIIVGMGCCRARPAGHKDSERCWPKELQGSKLPIGSSGYVWVCIIFNFGFFILFWSGTAAHGENFAHPVASSASCGGFLTSGGLILKGDRKVL